MNVEIQQGTSCIITRDIVLDGITVFAKGEQVVVDSVTPNEQRPEYKYVVTSQRAQKRYFLRDEDLVSMGTGDLQSARSSGRGNIPPASVIARAPEKTRWVRGNKRRVKFVVIGGVSLVIVAAAIFVAVVFFGIGKTTCPDCSGTGVVTRMEAGTISQDCPRCHGQGYTMQDKVNCAIAQAEYKAGFTMAGPPPEKPICSQCQGTGKIVQQTQVEKKETCPRCGGKGKIW